MSPTLPTKDINWHTATSPLLRAELHLHRYYTEEFPGENLQESSSESTSVQSRSCQLDQALQLCAMLPYSAVTLWTLWLMSSLTVELVKVRKETTEEDSAPNGEHARSFLPLLPSNGWMALHAEIRGQTSREGCLVMLKADVFNCTDLHQ